MSEKCPELLDGYIFFLLKMRLKEKNKKSQQE